MTSAQPRPQQAGISYDDALEQTLEIVRSGLSPSAFYQELTKVFGEYAEAEIVLLEADLGGQLIAHTWRDEEKDPDTWQAPAETFLTDVRRDGEPRVCQLGSSKVDACLVAMPLLDDEGDVLGAFALVTHTPAIREVAASIRTLAMLASLQGRKQAEQAAPARKGPSGKALKRLAGFQDKHELLFAITGSLRNKAGCDVAAIGLVNGKRVKIECVSGQEEVKRGSPALMQLEGAMEECLDLNELVLVQREGGSPSPPLLHRAASESAGDAPIASFPVRQGEDVIAIVTLRRPKEEPFIQDELDAFAELVQPYLEGLELVDRASRSVAKHVAASTKESTRSLFARGSWGRKAIAAAVFSFVAWFAFGTTDFTIEAPCTVSATDVQHLTAPFEGRLISAPLVAGDPFRTGDILATFDATALELDASRLRADREIARLDERQALAEGDALGVSHARLQIDSLGAQLDEIEHRIEEATVRAPFDGFVLEGDLRARIGDAATQGEPLFRLARAGSLRVELAVPEGDVLHVENGFSGEFACFARPEEPGPFEVNRIFPGVDPETEGVRVEANALDTAPWLRPGMEGVARVDVGSRKVWWVATRKLVNSMHLRFWL